MTGTVTTEGLGEFIRACDAAGKESKKLVRDRLREVAKPVLASARGKLLPIDARSASKLGISVRRTGIVSVEQRLKKTTGRHPTFGALQMQKALLPALAENTEQIERGFEKAMDEIVDHFKRKV